MDPNTINTVLVIAAIAVGVYLFFKLAQTVLKVVSVVLIVGLVYFFWQGGDFGDIKDSAIESMFNKSSTISGLIDTYCPPEKADKVKCDCIVEPVYLDLQSRLSQAEITAIDASPDSVIAEIKISFRNKKSDIKSCLIKNKGSDLIDKLKAMKE